MQLLGRQRLVVQNASRYVPSIRAYLFASEAFCLNTDH